jgi:hypothetical protein
MLVVSRQQRTVRQETFDDHRWERFSRLAGTPDAGAGARSEQSLAARRKRPRRKP